MPRSLPASQERFEGKSTESRRWADISYKKRRTERVNNSSDPGRMSGGKLQAVAFRRRVARAARIARPIEPSATVEGSGTALIAVPGEPMFCVTLVADR